MDQLGQAAGVAMGGQAAQNPLLQLVTSVLGQNSSVGGLAGLVPSFQKAGLGDIVNSWVGTGKNMPVTPDQIKQGLRGDVLNQLAGKAGVSPDAASTQLSSLLPDVIDKVMPSGKIEAGGIDQLLKMFQGKRGASLPVDRQKDAAALWAHLLGRLQQAFQFAEERRRQSSRDSRVGGRVKRSPPAGFNFVAMSGANSMRFPRIVERGLLAH